MKVSIIIPIYNVQAYITRCLESVCRQTYQDIECILVDDCGKDNSINIAKSYIKQYTGSIAFHIIYHTHNQGLSGARNSGIKAATGDYIYFLDSDDAITPNSIETLVQIVTKYQDVDFVQGNFLNDNGEKGQYSFNNTVPEYCNKKEALEELMLHRLVTSSCNRLIKRSLLIERQLFFPVGILHEDMYWVYFFSKYIKAGAFTTQGTYIYSTHEGSIITSISKEMRVKRLQSRLIAAKAYYQDIRFNKPTSHSRRAYLCIDLFSCLHELINLHSLKHWVHFWCYICDIAFNNFFKATVPRIQFFLVLLPPICFWARKQAFRWRIQNRIISKV